jgi:hypothetical protein
MEDGNAAKQPSRAILEGAQLAKNRHFTHEAGSGNGQ